MRTRTKRRTESWLRHTYTTTRTIIIIRDGQKAGLHIHAQRGGQKAASHTLTRTKRHTKRRTKRRTGSTHMEMHINYF